MKTTVYVAAVTLIVCTLAGCASAIPTEPPSPRLMTPAKPLDDVKAGDDIVAKHAELRRQYGRETSKVWGLQAYVKALLNK